MDKKEYASKLMNMPQPNYSQEQHNYLVKLREGQMNELPEVVQKEIDKIGAYGEISRSYSADFKRIALLALQQGREQPVDPDSEAANPVWDLVIASCKRAWPDEDKVFWNESPLELITRLINERDEARGEVMKLLSEN